MTPPADAVRGPVFQSMLQLSNSGALPAHQQQCIRLPRPQEEFYALNQDPHELNNLIGDPAYTRVIAEHREALTSWKNRTHDLVPTFRTADEFERETGKVTPARIRPRPSKAEMRATRHP